MSGGHFEYVQDRVAEEMSGQWRDEELKGELMAGADDGLDRKGI